MERKNSNPASTSYDAGYDQPVQDKTEEKDEPKNEPELIFVDVNYLYIFVLML